MQKNIWLWHQFSNKHFTQSHQSFLGIQKTERAFSIADHFSRTLTAVEALKKYEADLVSYMLYGLIDENEDIVLLCTKLLDEAGLKRKLLSLELNEPID